MPRLRNAVFTLVAVLPVFGQDAFHVTGHALLEGGAALTERAEVVCEGGFRRYTDLKGYFSFSVGSGYPSDVSMARSCPSLVVSVTGYRSRRVFPIYEQKRLDWVQRPIELGAIVMHPLEHASEGTVSLNSAQAPDAARRAFERGMERAAKGKAAAAEAELRKAVATYPSFAAAWFEIGRLEEARGALDDARASYTRAAEADLTFARPLVQLALLEARQKNWPAVLQRSAAALKLSPSAFPEVLQVRAVALWKTGSLDGAIESAREAVRVDPQSRLPRSACILGSFLSEKGDKAGAIEAFRECLKHTRLDADAAVARAELEKLGAAN